MRNIKIMLKIMLTDEYNNVIMFSNEHMFK
jgi:hypothetical protein